MKRKITIGITCLLLLSCVTRLSENRQQAGEVYSLIRLEVALPDSLGTAKNLCLLFSENLYKHSIQLALCL